MKFHLIVLICAFGSIRGNSNDVNNIISDAIGNITNLNTLDINVDELQNARMSIISDARTEITNFFKDYVEDFNDTETLKDVIEVINKFDIFFNVSTEALRKVIATPAESYLRAYSANGLYDFIFYNLKRTNSFLEKSTSTSQCMADLSEEYGNFSHKIVDEVVDCVKQNNIVDIDIVGSLVDKVISDVIEVTNYIPVQLLYFADGGDNNTIIRTLKDLDYEYHQMKHFYEVYPESAYPYILAMKELARECIDKLEERVDQVSTDVEEAVEKCNSPSM